MTHQCTSYPAPHTTPRSTTNLSSTQAGNMLHHLRLQVECFASRLFQDQTVPGQLAQAAAMAGVLALHQHVLAQQAGSPLPARFQRSQISLTQALVLLIELLD